MSKTDDIFIAMCKDTLVKITNALEISLSDFFNVFQPNIVQDGKDSSTLNSIITKYFLWIVSNRKILAK